MKTKEEVINALVAVRRTLGMHMLELRYSENTVDIINSNHLGDVVEALEMCINKVKHHVGDDAEL